MCGTQPPAQSVHLPAIHWLLSNKTADKHSRASSGTEPCHWQEGEINEHPRGNQVWSCLFPKTCKNLGAGWLWTLDKASTWSAHSGKLLGPADRLFVVIHHHIFHGSEDKVSFWRFLKVKGLCRKTVISNGSKCTLKLWVFYFFWGLEPFAFPPFFFRKFLWLPIFQATEKQEDAQSAARLPGLPPHLCPVAGGCCCCGCSAEAGLSAEQSCGHPVLLQHLLQEPLI